MNPVIVDVVGASGSGKTTVGTELQVALAKAKGVHGSAILNAEAESLRVIRKFAEILKHPWLIVTAVQLSRHGKRRLSRAQATRFFLAALIRRSIVVERARHLEQGIAIIPAGAVFMMKVDREAGLERLPRRLRPTIIIELNSPTHLRTARVIMRGRVDNRVPNDSAMRKTHSLYRKLRAGFDVHSTRELLHHWNLKFTENPVPNEDMDGILDDCEEELKSNAINPLSQHRTTAPLEAQGSRIVHDESPFVARSTIGGVTVMSFDTSRAPIDILLPEMASEVSYVISSLQSQPKT